MSVSEKQNPWPMFGRKKMKDKRVVIRDYIHNDLDCKTIPEAIAMLQSWLDHGKEFRDMVSRRRLKEEVK
jgi:hypothetical protein